MPPNYTLGINTCYNVKPGTSCQIRLIYSSSDLDKGSHTDTVTIGDSDVDLTVNQVSNPNSLGYISVDIAENIHINDCIPVGVSVKDDQNLPFVSSNPIVLNSSISLFSDNNCSSAASLSLSAFESSKTWYFKSLETGSKILQISINSIQSSKSLYVFEDLQLSLSSSNLVIGNTVNLLAIGGKPNLVYDIVSGGGSISNNVYIPDSLGLKVVRVTDSLGHTAQSQLEVFSVLNATELAFEKVVGQNYQALVAGGKSPYTYSIHSGVGTINSELGIYSSANAGLVDIKVKDALNQEVHILGTTYNLLQLSANKLETVLGQGNLLTTVGGKSAIVLAIVSGGGSLIGNNYVADSIGTKVLKATDALGQISQISVEVFSVLTAGSNNFERIVNQNYTPVVSGGKTPYVYSVNTGVGTIGSASGVFSSANAGTVDIKIKDALNQEVSVLGNIYSVLDISPKNGVIILSSNQTFSGVGGKSPYTFELVSGVGTINLNTGLFASTQAGVAQIKVTDSLGQTSQTGITINSNLSVSAGTCAGYSVPESVNCTVSSSGGIGTKTYTTNVGTIDPVTGVFKGVCVANLGSSIVTVTDQYGNSANTTISYPCVYKSCNQIRAEGLGITNGNYWLDVDALGSGQDPFYAYCSLNDADGAGWTMIASGGSSCVVNSVNTMTAKTSGLSLTTCGFIPNTLVPSIAQSINSVRLRGGLSHSNYEQVTSTGVNTINALKNSTSWHNGAAGEWTGNTWIWGTMNGCQTPAATSWPNMYHSCDNGNGVHWLVAGTSSNHARKYNSPATDVASSTWVKTNYYKHPTSCLDAKNKGILNQAGTTASGVFTIDQDGFGYGAAPFDVYCDQENDGGGWTLVYTQQTGGYLTMMARNAALVTPSGSGSHQKLESIYAASTESRWTDMNKVRFMQFSAYASQTATSPSPLSTWSSALLNKACNTGDPTIWMRFSNGYLNTATQARKVESCYIPSTGGATYFGFRNNVTYAPIKDVVNNTTTHECWHDENAADRVFAVHGTPIGAGHCNQFGYSWPGTAGRGGSMNYMIWAR